MPSPRKSNSRPKVKKNKIMEILEKIKGINRKLWLNPKRASKRINRRTDYVLELSLKAKKMLVEMCNRKTMPSWQKVEELNKLMKEIKKGYNEVAVQSLKLEPVLGENEMGEIRHKLKNKGSILVRLMVSLKRKFPDLKVENPYH